MSCVTSPHFIYTVNSTKKGYSKRNSPFKTYTTLTMPTLRLPNAPKQAYHLASMLTRWLP